MNKIELANYPLAIKAIKEWFLKVMIESFKNSEVPEEFKDFMLKQGIEEDNIETLINLNTRALFDFFDENEIYIQIGANSDNKSVYFQYKINDFLIGNCFRDLKYKIRKEAEFYAVKESFEMLEEKLTPLKFNNLKEE